MPLSDGSSCRRPQVSCGRSRIRCYCGEEATLRMSWKVVMFGRRFFKCPKMQHEQCSFFDWLDNPKCQWSREVGQKVQDKILKLEDEIKELKLNEEYLRKSLGWLDM
ncbi:zinc finger, GRF-type [Senna tora]|uniref:Zinc finger, GRF-type n=1 Tax=Senna tora TaxID=362788 RepID=A0A834SPM9_9FABA|nr:zinc finger, GRF-type [Senna tora]